MLSSSSLSLFLILFLSSFSSAKNRSLQNSIQAFSKLSKPSSLVCKSDDDEKKPQFLICDMPRVIKILCVEKIPDEADEDRLLIEVNCKICNLPLEITALAKGRSSSENPTGTLSWPHGIYHSDSSTSLDLIKESCKNSNAFSDDEFQGFYSLDRFITEGEDRNRQYYDSGAISSYVDIKYSYTGNEKECEGSDGDESQEAVTEHIKNNPEPEPPVTAAPVLDDSDQLGITISYHRKGPAVKKFSLTNLSETMSYEIKNSKANQKEVEGRLKFKLGAQDTKYKVHHLIFDQSLPKEDIAKVLEANINLHHSKRIFDLRCEAETEEHLNVSVRLTETEITTERYKILCSTDDTGQKTLTLKLMK